MKVFFDTNVYVAEALLGKAAVDMLATTLRIGWRIFCTEYVLDEVERVLALYREVPRPMVRRTRSHIRRRAELIDVAPSKHQVPADPKDSPILAGAVQAGADYLVTNDPHLLSLNPYESVRIISMTEYFSMLQGLGHLL